MEEEFFGWDEKHQKWMSKMEISATQLTTRASKAIICWCYHWKMSDANTPHSQNRVFFALAADSLSPVPKTLKESYHCLLLARRSFLSQNFWRWNEINYFFSLSTLRQRRLRVEELSEGGKLCATEPSSHFIYHWKSKHFRVKKK